MFLFKAKMNLDKEDRAATAAAHQEERRRRRKARSRGEVELDVLYLGSLLLSDWSPSRTGKEAVKSEALRIGTEFYDSPDAVEARIMTSTGGIEVITNKGKLMAHAAKRIGYFSVLESSNLISLVAYNPDVSEPLLHVFEFARGKRTLDYAKQLRLTLKAILKTSRASEAATSVDVPGKAHQVRSRTEIESRRQKIRRHFARENRPVIG